MPDSSKAQVSAKPFAGGALSLTDSKLRAVSFADRAGEGVLQQSEAG